MEKYRRHGIEAATLACGLALALAACSGSSDSNSISAGGGGHGGSALAGSAGTASGAGSGSAGSSSGGLNHGGASASSTGAGQAGQDQAGTNTGGAGSSAGTGGAALGGSSTGGGGGGGNPNQGGSGGEGITSTNCTLESLHLKVKGGTTFERSAQSSDACGGSLGGEHQELGLTFFVKPPELENTLLISATGNEIEPGKTSSFTPAMFALATTGAIWSIHQPDAEHPLACNVSLTQFTMVPPTSWRVAGSISCPAPISGIGQLGNTPLEILDFKFGMVFDPTR